MTNIRTPRDQITALTLSNRNITELPSDLFQGVGKLKRLIMGENPFTSIHSSTKNYLVDNNVTYIIII